MANRYTKEYQEGWGPVLLAFMEYASDLQECLMRVNGTLYTHCRQGYNERLKTALTQFQERYPIHPPEQSGVLQQIIQELQPVCIRCMLSLETRDLIRDLTFEFELLEASDVKTNMEQELLRPLMHVLQTIRWYTWMVSGLDKEVFDFLVYGGELHTIMARMKQDKQGTWESFKDQHPLPKPERFSDWQQNIQELQGTWESFKDQHPLPKPERFSDWQQNIQGLHSTVKQTLANEIWLLQDDLDEWLGQIPPDVLSKTELQYSFIIPYKQVLEDTKMWCWSQASPYSQTTIHMGWKV